ncbi:hypothetical protein AA106556_0847 [Neokomagataea tanensis NBRC 106556]|uniref:Transposase n=1 Tax=Neokomagataea tanensis NBRC 106556 TaxID=1223519 RepID=A0ABQ0QIC3_9PROT|nr:hypothetical protein AA106556_0847 [Neokomagataea tanensis NBRC 106556]
MACAPPRKAGGKPEGAKEHVRAAEYQEGKGTADEEQHTFNHEAMLLMRCHGGRPL